MNGIEIFVSLNGQNDYDKLRFDKRDAKNDPWEKHNAYFSIDFWPRAKQMTDEEWNKLFIDECKKQLNEEILRPKSDWWKEEYAYMYKDYQQYIRALKLMIKILSKVNLAGLTDISAEYDEESWTEGSLFGDLDAYKDWERGLLQNWRIEAFIPEKEWTKAIGWEAKGEH